VELSQQPGLSKYKASQIIGSKYGLSMTADRYNGSDQRVCGPETSMQARFEKKRQPLKHGEGERGHSCRHAGPQPTNSKLQSTNYEPESTNHDRPTQTHQPQTQKHKPPLTNPNPPTPNLQAQTTIDQPQPTSPKLKSTNHH